jgi:hypothetical protein
MYVCCGCQKVDAGLLLCATGTGLGSWPSALLLEGAALRALVFFARHHTISVGICRAGRQEGDGCGVKDFVGAPAAVAAAQLVLDTGLPSLNCDRIIFYGRGLPQASQSQLYRMPSSCGQVLSTAMRVS